MCGITGILLRRTTSPSCLGAIGAMAATLHHRGPDGEGIWFDDESGIALGHRRLAIIDLSEAGHQPMLSADGNLAITFNGEIYNFRELRSALVARGHHFRGDSDTEIMLAAFESYGIEAALKQFSGMFAAGIWDRERRVLHLVRDRMGKKPLYVALNGGALLFASELKAFLADPSFQPTIDKCALAIMLRQGWVPDGHCIWKNVFKLPPGSMLSVRAEDLDNVTIGGLRERVKRWWSLAEVAESGQRQPFEGDESDIDVVLERLLADAVRQRMVADVPLGAFLSGGIDSSTIVALMQAQSSRPIRTFTIGFHEVEYDEAAHASEVARHLGTKHTEFRLGPAETCEIIPGLPQVWDEPFADESQIPTLLLSHLTRQHVTVALSGDGGDECFGGYSRHFMLARLTPLLRLPAIVRKPVASVLASLTSGTLDEMGRRQELPLRLRRAVKNGNLQKVARALRASGEHELYDQLVAFGTSSLVLDTEASDAAAVQVPPLPDAVARLIYRDMVGYLPGDILVKLDRATMAASLEGRCPFLDDRVIEFAWRLPTAAKVHHGRGKWPLRRMLARYLPQGLFERPKQGFNVPIGEWLAGPLRGWAEDLLDGGRIRREGLLDADRVQACWQQHLTRRGDRSGELWAVLMVQAWLEFARKARPHRIADIRPLASSVAQTGGLRAYG